MFTPKFSVGYNFDYSGFVKILKKYKSDIGSVYFPIPKKYLGSGRIIDEPINYERDMLSLIKACNELKIKPFMLLNSTLPTPLKIAKTIDYVLPLYKKGILKQVTVTDPYLMMRIKKEMPQMYIAASTLCRIKTVEEAKYFKEIGVSSAASDRETIRDLPLLRKIRKVLPLKLLANEGCIKNCIYKYSHYNILSANIDEKPFFPFGKYSKIKSEMDEMDSLCVSAVRRHPHKIFSSPFIRPEDLKRYEGITNIFKLSTRNFDTNRIEKTLKAYISQRYNGNLVEILNTSYIDAVFEFIDNQKLNEVNFFEKLSGCNDDCDRCDFCRELLIKTNARLKKRNKL